LYGFPSADSDFDLRGVHLLPLDQLVGLDVGEETVTKERVHDGLEIDLVTHDARKFFELMLKKNGYVLEQLLSPLVVATTPEHQELIAAAQGCVTRHHAHHYLGFAKTQWALFNKSNPPRIKPLLYVYRVILTGIHLMRTGTIEANLRVLNDEKKLPFIDDLVHQKMTGPEKGTIDATDLSLHETTYFELVSELESAALCSQLPEVASAKAELNSLLVRLRLAGTTSTT
jgi:predicted nucleotidyltransferase